MFGINVQRDYIQSIRDEMGEGDGGRTPGAGAGGGGGVPFISSSQAPPSPVSRFGLAVRRCGLVSRRALARIRFGSPFTSKRVVWSVDTVL